MTSGNVLPIFSDSLGREKVLLEDGLPALTPLVSVVT